MSRPVRFAFAAALLALLAAFYLVITRPATSSTVDAQRRFTSSAQCRDCHVEVYDEWHGSHHQIAYENPEVRRLSDDFRNKECQACHLPRLVAETGLLRRTLPRRTRPSEGVDCLTCHLGTEGRVIGMRGGTEGCAPIADSEFLSVALCETCHNQHTTTDQWRASAYARDGTTCNDCHMPRVERPDGRAGRRHVFEGCHDEETLRAAATLAARRDGGDLVVEVANTGAGHNFPTEERHRAVDVLVRFAGADGTSGEWERRYRFRQPYRDEPGEDTQLPAGETHVERVRIPDGAVRADVRLWYRLNPYASDEDPASTLLFERRIEL